MHSIVARALVLNSELLRAQGQRSANEADWERLEARLLQLASAWRLFLRSPARAQAREGYDRLRVLQRRLEDRVVLARETERWQHLADLSAPTRAMLLEVTRRIQADPGLMIPQRELEQALQDDSDALGELSLELKRLGPQVPLAETVELEAAKAARRVQHALAGDATMDQQRRGRRWLLLNVSHQELLQDALSEEAARAGWYRGRLAKVMSRLCGLKLLDDMLLRRPPPGMRLAQEQAEVRRRLAREAEGLRQRCSALARHAFDELRTSGSLPGETEHPVARVALPVTALG